MPASDAINQRIILSRATLSRYEQAFLANDLTAPPAQYAKLFADEIAYLRSIIDSHPDKRETLTALISRYEKLSLDVVGKG